MNQFNLLIVSFAFLFFSSGIQSAEPSQKPRVLVTTDGEIDDECSLVRFLLYANEWDIEGIITSSSQYHWQGHKWAGDDWAQPYLEAYAKVYPNLIQHDANYPAPEFLQARTLLGNVKTEGEMGEVTPGSKRIVEVLLDDSDPRPIWIQAWGGTNTIARALKTIEEEHPEKMVTVAKKIRFYFIWEQDDSYQDYIRPHWGKYAIPTILSDQFIAIFYHWKKYLPADKQAYLTGSWMKPNILENHGPLCALYKAHGNGDKGFDEGDFRSEGDSPSFLHTIPTGLRNMESPDRGGWGGRFVKVRDNIWLDALQNDFAARADWCVKEFTDANHAPVIQQIGAVNRTVTAGETVKLAASATDPDGNTLTCRWWQYAEADSAAETVTIANNDSWEDASFIVSNEPGKQVHIILEVTDNGMPPLVGYQRIIFDIK